MLYPRVKVFFKLNWSGDDIINNRQKNVVVKTNDIVITKVQLGAAAINDIH